MTEKDLRDAAQILNQALREIAREDGPNYTSGAWQTVWHAIQHLNRRSYALMKEEGGRESR